VEEKNVSGVQPVHAVLPPAFNATAHASHVDDSSKELGQQQQQQQQLQQRRYNQLETQLVQDQQPHSTTIDQKESSDTQPDGAPQGRAKDESLIVESLIESHAADIQRLTQEHDAAVAQQQQQQQQLQEQLRAAEETVVLLNLRTQRLEGSPHTPSHRHTLCHTVTFLHTHAPLALLEVAPLIALLPLPGALGTCDDRACGLERLVKTEPHFCWFLYRSEYVF
jgi:hypothetical protein